MEAGALLDPDQARRYTDELFYPVALWLAVKQEGSWPTGSIWSMPARDVLWVKRLNREMESD